MIDFPEQKIYKLGEFLKRNLNLGDLLEIKFSKKSEKKLENC
jgi:hypothetical protein